jgi:hypothetical protein
MVVHAYNPSYLGGGDKKDLNLRAAQAKKSVRLYLNK